MRGRKQRLLLNGKGIDDLLKILNKTGITETVYPGEIHLKGHNFTGPGTNLEQRKNNPKNKSDYIPINKLDKASMKHDLSYNKISNDRKTGKIDDKQALTEAHLADDEFVAELKRIPGFSLTQELAAKAILLKKWLEAKQILAPETFSIGRGIETGEFDFQSGTGIHLAGSKIFKNYYDPAHSLRKQIASNGAIEGGFVILPFLLPILGSVVADLSIEGIKAAYKYFKTDRPKTLSGAGIKDNNDKFRDDLMKKIVDKLDNMPGDKQIEMVNSFIHKID